MLRLLAAIAAACALTLTQALVAPRSAIAARPPSLKARTALILRGGEDDDEDDDDDEAFEEGEDEDEGDEADEDDDEAAGDDGDDGDDDDGRISPEHPSPILHAPKDIISRKGKCFTPIYIYICNICIYIEREGERKHTYKYILSI